jgi:uncharacterized membrane protein YjjB (DUF3815 family)
MVKNIFIFSFIAAIFSLILAIICNNTLQMIWSSILIAITGVFLFIYIVGEQ